jgi:hypothetical protein
MVFLNHRIRFGLDAIILLYSGFENYGEVIFYYLHLRLHFGNLNFELHELKSCSTRVHL